MQQALLSAGLPPPGIAPGQYSGGVKSYNLKQGYGFLECAEARAHYGRDVFIHKAQMGELLGRFVGPGTRLEPTALRMRVNFSVEVNKSGMPQARDVTRIDDAPEAETPAASPATAEGAFPSAGSSAAPMPFAPMAAAAPQAAAGPEEAVASGGAEAWGGEDTPATKVKGYKGRGGTIRILNSSEAQSPRGQASSTVLLEDAVGAAPQQGGLRASSPMQGRSRGAQPRGPRRQGGQGGPGREGDVDPFAHQQDLQGTVQPQPTPQQEQSMRGIRNRGWQPRGPRRQGGQGGEVDPFVRQQEAWEMEEEQAYGMQRGGSGGCGASQAGPREGGRRRGKKAGNDDYFQQGGSQVQAFMHPMFAPQAAPPYMQPQPFAVQPYMYGMQGPQAMLSHQGTPGPAAYGAPFAQQAPPQQPPGAGPMQAPLQQLPSAPPLQFPPTFVSQQFPQPPVQAPYQPDGFPPQFLPYQQQQQQQQQQQFQQQFQPQQLQMLQQEPSIRCYGLDTSGVGEFQEGQPFGGELQEDMVNEYSEMLEVATMEELPGECMAEHDADWATGIDQPGASSGMQDAVTSGSGSQDDDGHLGFRVSTGDFPLMHGGCPGPGGAALIAMLPGVVPGSSGPCVGVAGAGLVASGSSMAAGQAPVGWQQVGATMPLVDGLHAASGGRDYLAL